MWLPLDPLLQKNASPFVSSKALLFRSVNLDDKKLDLRVVARWLAYWVIEINISSGVNLLTVERVWTYVSLSTTWLIYTLPV